MSLYNTDFLAWLNEQATALRDRAFTRLDLENLIEELESLSRQERQQLENRLAVLLAHLLKWRYQPGKRSHSWWATIKEQRRRILRLLKSSPSLKPYLQEAIEIGYGDGRLQAVAETGLDELTFPETCPYISEQILDSEWLPE